MAPDERIIPPRVKIRSRRIKKLSDEPNALDPQSLDLGGDLEPGQISEELGETLKDFTKNISPDP